jgi:DNA-binding MarR family transcriptional regulator
MISWLDDSLPSSGTRTVELARAIYALRRERASQFTRIATLMGEPAWDLLLFLFIAHEEGRHLGVVEACDGSQCPRTTAMRHISACEAAGYVLRISDPADARRSILQLSGDALIAMRHSLTNFGGICHLEDAREIEALPD